MTEQEGRADTTTAPALAAPGPWRALGVVYGDIGTSPLYALKECFTAAARTARPTPENVLGVLSLIFWSLNFVIVVQVPRLRHAGRQPRRGRHPRAAGAGRGPRQRRAPGPARCSSCSGSSAPRCSTATASSRRRSRCSARSRASRSRRPALAARSSCRIAVDHPRRCSSGSSSRGTGARRPGLRPGHDRLVRLHRRARRRAASCGDPDGARGAQPVARRRGSSSTHRLARLPRPRRGRPGGHRRRGALRRHGPLRPPPDPARLVRAWCCRRCCSTTSGRARCCSREPGGRRQPVLSRWCPGWCLYPMVVDRDAGRDRRVAGAHLRRVLAHPAGGAARLLPARAPSSTPRARRSGRSTCPRSTGRSGVGCVVAGARLPDRPTNLAAAYGIAVTGTMVITTLLFYRGDARPLALEPAAGRAAR